MIALTVETLRSMSSAAVFERGTTYVQAVFSLNRRDGQAQSLVEGTIPYSCELSWNDVAAWGSCTCPFSRQGNFCKHLVATGLHVVAEQSGLPVQDVAARARDGLINPADHEALVQRWLKGMSADGLRELCASLMSTSDDVAEFMRTRAIFALGKPADIERRLKDIAQRALSTSRRVDYYRSFKVADAADHVLAVFVQAIKSGAASATIQPLQYVLTRLRTILLKADDSSGLLQQSLHSAILIHAHACHLVQVDAVKLAKWLAKYRTLPGFMPDIPLELYADLFDQSAMAVYRYGVHAYANSADAHDFTKKFLLLELADYDGDVDQAIALLSEGARPEFGSIISRLRQAGRIKESLRWVDQALAANSVVDSPDLANEYWIASTDVAQWWYEDGRKDDALAFLQTRFQNNPNPQLYSELLDIAGQLGRVEEVATWAKPFLKDQG